MSLGAGGAVVVLSDGPQEWQEVLLKARPVMQHAPGQKGTGSGFEAWTTHQAKQAAIVLVARTPHPAAGLADASALIFVTPGGPLLRAPRRNEECREGWRDIVQQTCGTGHGAHRVLRGGVITAVLHALYPPA